MLGNRLRMLRENKGMSQIELGKILGIGNVTLSQYEKETRNPDNETLIKIADFFNVSVDYLLGRENENSTTFLDGATGNFVSEEKKQVLSLLEEISDDEAKKLLDIYLLMTNR